MSETEVPFVNEPAVANDEQAAVLRAALDVLKAASSFDVSSAVARWTCARSERVRHPPAESGEGKQSSAAAILSAVIATQKQTVTEKRMAV